MNTKGLIKTVTSILLIVSIMLLVYSSSESGFDNRIARTNIPGTFYCLKIQHQGYWTWLAKTTDYGHTLEFVRDSVTVLHYHPEFEAMLFVDHSDISYFHISHDGGITSERFFQGPGYSIGLTSNPDSIVFVQPRYFHYSLDTAQTWQYNDRTNLEGLHSLTEYKDTGWSSGDLAVVSIFWDEDGDNDSVRFYFSEDYCDTFSLRGSFSSDLAIPGLLFRGYGQGEYYLVKYEDHIIYCSTDTGRTWTESGPTPVEFGELTVNFATDLAIEPGWENGEIFYHHTFYDFYFDTKHFYLFYSTDYGQSWEHVHGMDDSYVEGNAMSELPEYYSIQSWPNPFNSEAKISVTIPSSSFYEINIFNLLGKKLETLEAGYIMGGTYNYHFDGAGLSSGIYFIQLNGDDIEITRRIYLIK